MINKTVCSKCEAIFAVNLKSCPNCNSGDRNVSVVDMVHIRDDLRTDGITPNPAGGKPLEEFRLYTKVSGKTKREAIKKVTVERSKETTTVLDEVWELFDKDRWFIVHRHYK